MRLIKDISDDLLVGAGVHNLDPEIPLLACQAEPLLGRSLIQLERDRASTLGSVLKQRREGQTGAAPTAKSGLPTFQAFVAGGPQGTDTWPMLRVDGFPVDLFASLTLGLHPDRVDPEGVEDMTLGHILEERAGFYRGKQDGWGMPPRLLGKEWGERLLHLTSKEEIFSQAYEKAIKIYEAESQEGVLAERRSAMATARELKREQNYDLLRQVLNDAPEDFYMTRAMAQFFLNLSPKQFSRDLKRGPHPFGHSKAGGGGHSGATKAQVIAWAKIYVDPYRKAVRSASALQRAYLIDDTGTVLADTQGSNIGPLDMAYAVSIGADILTMTLEQALAHPWRSINERRAWGDARLSMMELALSAAREKELQLRIPAAATRTRPRVRP